MLGDPDGLQDLDPGEAPQKVESFTGVNHNKP